MAGHGHNPLAVDPALAKYANMYTVRHKYFRWTGRTAGLFFAWVIAVPSVLGYVAYTTDGKYIMRGKKRGDTIAEF